MKTSHFFINAAIVCVVAIPVVVLNKETSIAQQLAGSPVNLPVEGSMPSLAHADAWLNSPALATAELRGKVVLVEFWTYSCINWRRELPYVRAWAEKYKNKGLVVIGVHSPEFEFEKSIDNIQWALKAMAIDYPIAVDSKHSVWRAFSNAYWPALYFIDAQGRIRHHQFGEGNYEQSEKVLKSLLRQAGATGIDESLVSIVGVGAEAEADWNSLRTMETYLGHDRAQNFASPSGIVTGKSNIYRLPAHLNSNQWALSGDWTVGREGAVLGKANGRIVFRFHARDLHLVMGPSDWLAPVRFRIRIDGKAPGAAHGLDVDIYGNGVSTEQRLYQLIRQTHPIADREFEIEFLDAGAEAFSFTFG